MTCVHHYIVGPKVGYEAAGECKKCGHQRVFREAEKFDWTLKVNQDEAFLREAKRRMATVEEWS